MVDRRWSPTVATAVTAGVVAVLVGLAVAPVSPARGAPLRDCTRTHGTIVAVDFGHWGGPIVRGCGVGARTGYALLRAAGFTTTGDAHDGPAFICRLGDSAFHHDRQYPTPQQQPCVVTPPATAHWSYWLAPAGANRWSYSELGAMSEIPHPGEVELWTFGATNSTGTKGSALPALRPAALRQPVPANASGGHTTTTRTTTTRTTSARTRTATTTRAARTTATAAPATTTAARTTSTRAQAARPRHTRGAAHTTTTATTAHTATATTTATHTATRAATGGSKHATSTTKTAAHPATTARTTPTSATRHPAGRERVVAARPTTQHASSGSAAPLIVAAALVALLAAGALRTLRMRRRQE